MYKIIFKPNLGDNDENGEDPVAGSLVVQRLNAIVSLHPLNRAQIIYIITNTICINIFQYVLCHTTSIPYVGMFYSLNMVFKRFARYLYTGILDNVKYHIK